MSRDQLFCVYQPAQHTARKPVGVCTNRQTPNLKFALIGNYVTTVALCNYHKNKSLIFWHKGFRFNKTALTSKNASNSILALNSRGKTQ